MKKDIKDPEKELKNFLNEKEKIKEKFNEILKELNIDDELKRITLIDVIWYDDSDIKYIFEIENSTNITSAIERASNIPEKHDVKRFIVIPEERQKMFNRKMNEPMFEESYKKYKRRFISRRNA